LDIEFHLDLLCHFAVIGRAVTYALGLALLAYPQKKKFPGISPQEQLLFCRLIIVTVNGYRAPTLLGAA